jgi:hypothetical protein
LSKDYSENNTHPETLYSNKKSTGEQGSFSAKCEQGRDTHFDGSQNPLQQGLEGVPTSPQQGRDTPPKLEKVTDEDAKKMRDIALLWWSEYYPEQKQALLTQMFGWQTPGTKYDGAILAEWLKGEEKVVCDRITELIRLRGN